MLFRALDSLFWALGTLPLASLTTGNAGLMDREVHACIDSVLQTSALSTIRRESAMVRGGPVDKGSAMHLKNLLLERLDTEEAKVRVG